MVPFLGTPVFFLQIEPKSADFLYSGVFGHGELESSRIFYFELYIYPYWGHLHKTDLNQFSLNYKVRFFIKLPKNNLFRLDFVCISHKNRKKLIWAKFGLFLKIFLKKSLFSIWLQKLWAIFDPLSGIFNHQHPV